MIRGVLFDMDGVLLDTERLGMTLMPEIAKALGYSYSTDLYRKVLGTNAADTGKIYRDTFGPDFPIAKLEQAFYQRLADMASAGTLPLKKGFLECFAGLRARGLQTALATSTDRPMVEHYQKAIPAFRDVFDATVCGMESPQGKPEPHIYLAAAQKLGLSPAECIGVEDSKNGVRSLRAAGCYCVMIPDLLPYDEGFAPYVDAVLSNLTELCPLIDRLNQGQLGATLEQ